MNGVSATQTSIASWSYALGRTLQDYGLDHVSIFCDVGLDWSASEKYPYERFPVARVQQVWQYAYANTDELFGVSVVKHLTPASFHCLSYSLYSSDTILGLLERLVRYRSVISQLVFAELLIDDDKVVFITTDQRAIKTNVTNDTLFYYLLQLIRQISTPDYSPRSIHLARTPKNNAAELREIFGTPIEFGSDDNAIIFERSDADARLPNGNRELAAKLDDLVEQYVNEHGLISEYMMRVRAVIGAQLEHGAVSISDVAEALNITVRTLQRRLANEQASYHDLLDDIRYKLAIDCAKDPQMNATQTAFRLGFSDSGSFGRSFKRWTGRSFRDYRSHIPNAH